MSKRDLSMLVIGIICGGLVVGGTLVATKPIVNVKFVATVTDTSQQESPSPDTTAPEADGPAQQFALDGYCPVTLMDGHRWTAGIDEHTHKHEDQVYRFAGAAEQLRFQQQPERYVPAGSGNDIVLAKESGKAVRGKRKHGVYYDDRIYLFATEASLARFSENPSQYIDDRTALGFKYGANGMVDLGN